MVGGTIIDHPRNLRTDNIPECCCCKCGKGSECESVAKAYMLVAKAHMLWLDPFGATILNQIIH